jgi:hypothetical protein
LRFIIERALKLFCTKPTQAISAIFYPYISIN